MFNKDAALKLIKRSPYEIEIYSVASKSLSIEIREQKIEAINSGHDYGTGIRVLHEGRLGFAYGVEANKELLDAATANMRVTPSDNNYSFAQPAAQYAALDLYDSEINNTALDEKIKAALDIENAAISSDARVKKTETCQYLESETQITVMNSKGLIACETSNCCGGYVSAICEQNGEAEEGSHIMLKRKYADFSAVETEIGRAHV